jgi:hypothetical protein
MFNLFSSAVLFLIAGLFSRPAPETSPYPSTVRDCPEISIKYSIKKNESALYSIDFELMGGSSPYKLVFYKASGKLVSYDFTKTGFSGLSSGDYQLTAIDKNNCRVTQKVQLP